MIVVCVTARTTCSAMIAYAAELAKERGEALTVVHVCRPGEDILGTGDTGAALQYLFECSKAAGAEMHFIRAEKITRSIAAYAGENGATAVVLGRLHGSGEESRIVEKLRRRLPAAEIIPFDPPA